ncbi:MAG: sodium:proton antiporter [Promethearchaeota archaeon]
MQYVKKHWLLVLLALPVVPLLLVVRPPFYTWSDVTEIVDVRTVSSIANLLVVTTGVKASNVLEPPAHFLVARVREERSLALILVFLAALSSTVFTNDVALFLVVPFTLELGESREIDTGKLVVFEAVAANVGSALTPIGNPQNLYLWHANGIPFWTFVAGMLPLFLVLAGILCGVTIAYFPAVPCEPKEVTSSRVDGILGAMSVLLMIPVVVCAQLGWSPYAFPLVVGLYLLLSRDVLLRVDWALLGVFVLMFVDFNLVASLPVVTSVVGSINLESGPVLFTFAALLSQVTSNVPAAIFLSRFTSNWRVLAYGANVGGNGLVIGSLANLIAIRLAEPRVTWKKFHAYSIPFFLASGLVSLLFVSAFWP